MQQEPASKNFSTDTNEQVSTPELNRDLPQLSVVIPCYNEEEVLPETTSRLCALLEALVAKNKILPNSRVYYVDDGSRDRTWTLIQSSAAKSIYIKGLKLSRNRGHQYALLAGLHSVPGDAIISIDADLQDDLNVIEHMVDAYQQGKDIVYGVRNERSSDSFFKRITAESYYKLLSKLGVELIHNHADYRLLSRTSLEALKCYDEVNLFIRGVIPTLGFPSSIVEYTRDKRFAGESKYPIHKMLSLAIQGVTSFSPTPLRLIAGLGFFVSLISLALLIWALAIKLFNPDAVPGWASSVIPIYFIGGIQLLSLGVVGEYISKIYLEVKRRPRFFIEKSI
jgi:glycosyltransferase involved in cell wall biosynthesis